MIPGNALAAFGFNPEKNSVIAFGTGLINSTWKVDAGDASFILQKINNNVFRAPYAIADNLSMIGSYLQQKDKDYLFVKPVETTHGQGIFYDETDNGYYRLLPFVKGSHTIDVVEHPSQAYEAARQFGRFTKKLSGIDISKIKITLPDFHNLSLRYQQFEDALKNGNRDRIHLSAAYIEQLKSNKNIVDIYESITRNQNFKQRVTHHDTKISNVLFDEHNKGLCVIDLDTVMPGYFISDVGDMMRTYLSPVSEEEKDFSKIEVRTEYFRAIAEGYLSDMKDELSHEELQYFVYSGKFLVYMQALRFLTDYINDDVYYGSKYEGHNYLRAGNQLVLLQLLIGKEHELEMLVKAFS